MSIRTLLGIKKLVEPYMNAGTLQVRPSDDGLHLTGYDAHGIWREFTCLSQALNFANGEYHQRQQGQGVARA